MIAAGLAMAKVDPQRMLRQTNDYLLAFFGKHLNGITAPPLDGPSPVHSEIVFGVPSTNGCGARWNRPYFSSSE